MELKVKLDDAKLDDVKADEKLHEGGKPGEERLLENASLDLNDRVRANEAAENPFADSDAGRQAAVETAKDKARAKAPDAAVKAEAKKVKATIESLRKEGKLTPTEAKVFKEKLDANGPEGLNDEIMDQAKGVTPRRTSITTKLAYAGGAYEVWSHRAPIILAGYMLYKKAFHGNDYFNSLEPKIEDVPGSQDKKVTLVNPETSKRETVFQGNEEACKKVYDETKGYLNGPVQSMVRSDLKGAIKRHPFVTTGLGGAMVIDNFIPGKPFTNVVGTMAITVFGSDAKLITDAVTKYGSVPIGLGLITAGTASLFGNNTLPNKLADMINTNGPVSGDTQQVIDRINGETTSPSKQKQFHNHKVTSATSATLNGTETEVATAQSKTMESLGLVSPTNLAPDARKAVKGQNVA